MVDAAIHPYVQAYLISDARNGRAKRLAVENGVHRSRQFPIDRASFGKIVTKTNPGNAKYKK
ncbi:MAG TPA: hypothetical protein DEF45_15870 [Rhodopirellula sp.]|nr:hypothetical protein [Rhodopirellula sp.]